MSARRVIACGSKYILTLRHPSLEHRRISLSHFSFSLIAFSCTEVRLALLAFHGVEAITEESRDLCMFWCLCTVLPPAHVSPLRSCQKNPRWAQMDHLSGFEGSSLLSPWLSCTMVGSQAIVPPSSPSILNSKELIEEKQWFCGYIKQ